MIVCICNNISDKGLTKEELYAKLIVSPKCGTCIRHIRRKKDNEQSITYNKSKG